MEEHRVRVVASLVCVADNWFLCDSDGDNWTDETGDLVTISPGAGVWYEKDFYFVTRGEGLTVKRNFEA